MTKTEYYMKLSELNEGKDISEKDVTQLRKRSEDMGIKIVHIESDDYPDSLRCIENPPLVLYCIGDTALLNTPGVPRIALVGTRRASPYGRWIAAELGRAIAKCGAIHISGMAEGIDSTGHRAVLNTGGKSIAVLGTGIDVCFPKSSRDVYDRLKTEGLIVSEYSIGTSGRPQNFPKRNRIISALCEKCVIAEGALRSGSLITARIALEQGKDIYAVPGNINQANSIGPNTLIEDGAIPIVNLSEIPETLGMVCFQRKINAAKLSGLEKRIYEFLKDAGSIKTEDLTAFLSEPAEDVLASLTLLELQGLIHNDGGIIS